MMAVTYNPDPPWPFNASATDYGRDLSCIEDLSQNMNEARGRQLLIEAIGRRLITPAGTLLPAGPNDTVSAQYGYDLTQWINADVGSAELADMHMRARQQCMADDRVRDAKVSIVFLTDALAVTITLYDKLGPFTFTRLISSVTTDLLEGSTP